MRFCGLYLLLIAILFFMKLESKKNNLNSSKKENDILEISLKLKLSSKKCNLRLIITILHYKHQSRPLSISH